MKHTHYNLIVLMSMTLAVIMSCGSSDDAGSESTVEDDLEVTTDSSEGTVDVTAVVQANFINTYTEAVSVEVNGDYISISSTGLPDHKTPYWGGNYEMYEELSGTNFY
ncbi:hypothetical protein [Formosa sp. L2A11]|uniref:hypothetical protein n=1 Tax=Formosa sp. L2A11 TaxID=2686363 RepID=UPI00131C9F51|nr:hypothetical protein [Formosa sp. L2A11]